MKSISYSLIAAAAAVGLAYGQNTATTTPVGYVTVNFPGNNSITAVSVTLAKPVEFTGTATSITDTTVTQTGAAWTANAWTGKLVYLQNAAGAEEAFLVSSNTADTLTVTAPFALTARYTNISKFTIGAAHTVGSLFGTAPADVKFTQGAATTADLLYLWNGTGYVTYNHNGTSWRKSGSLTSANNDVIFPDEGFFVLRRSSTPLEVVFSGQVPAKPQSTTIPGNGQTMVASRFPVGATIGSMGFQSLPGWQNGTATSGDRVYVWNGTGYTTYFYNGTNWRRTGSLTNVDNDVLPANAFMFVFRVSAGSGDQAAVHTLPYTLNP